MYGAFANEWSRSASITSFGDNGFAVFHAGHCDWHRPHSVQVAKSSQPFQEKSSTFPTPKVSFSGSASSRFSTSPPDSIGRSAPSAVRPVSSRLK